MFFRGEDDEERGGEDDEGGEDLEEGDRFAEEEPTEDEVEDRGELDEDAEVRRVVELEGFVIRDTGEAREGSGEDEEKDGPEVCEVDVETADGD